MAANYDFEKIVHSCIADVEKKIGRPLTDSQKQGLMSSGTLMFLESMMMGFEMAQNDADIEKWLQEIDGFHRQ